MKRVHTYSLLPAKSLEPLKDRRKSSLSRPMKFQNKIMNVAIADMNAVKTNKAGLSRINKLSDLSS